MMDFGLRVDPEHFAYLRIQKGSLDQYAGNFPEWHRRYQDGLREDFEQIAPWLPASCASVLDVGSGLGGIDILISRHYRSTPGPEPMISLLDGYDDKPKMRLHRKTFNSMYVARNFHVKNGVNPLALGSYATDVKVFDEPFDLIVSFGAWCFHVAPAEYLAAINSSGVKETTTLILDVRVNKPDWMADLEKRFELVTMVALKPKFSRCVFRVRP